MTIKRRVKAKMGLREGVQIRCPAHLAWVRGHACAVSDMCLDKIEAAHVRTGTDGGIGMKPGDNWTIPLCSFHHAKQHHIGEMSFERSYRIDMKKIAQEFWARSPHRIKYEAKHVRD